MARWAAAGIVGHIRDDLASRIRRSMGKGPRAVAIVIDSQSVKAAGTVSKVTRGYDAGKRVTWAERRLDLTVKTISRPKDTTGFVVLPRRWVVERSIAWMTHARCHARDYERSSSTPKP